MVINVTELEKIIQRLSKAICPDGTITDIEELIEWCEELNFAEDKLCHMVEREEELQNKTK
mgnify:CR=1 FL=1